MSTPLVLTYVGFFVMAAITLGGALMAVSARNLIRAALGLIIALIGIAGIYFVLEAEFVAVVQILVYVGAISILILFAVMLTRGLMKRDLPAQNAQWIAAAFISLAMFAALLYVALSTNWRAVETQVAGDLIPKLGTELMTTYLLPFEAVSLLLLAALVGAIVIARE
ncbi:MAG: NADH-quinone oxidoreductase subunit J [Chloroflexi bacterium]|nr:NADH-quinone oxidoreductase subunit J [Chloroflexota bacterium]